MLVRTLNLLYRAATLVASLFTYIACGAGILLTVFVVLASVMRYVVGSPFGFTEELVGLLFSALVFLALPYAAVNDQHIRVAIVTDRLPHRLRLATRWLSYALILVFCIVFGSLSWQFATFSYDINAKSDVARLVLYPWMALTTVGVTLLGIIVALKLARSIAGAEASDETPPLLPG